MKSILFSLVLLFSAFCSAQSFNSNDVFTGIDSKSNYIKNPWAKDNGLYSSSNNATILRGTTDKLFGMSSWSCDASAQNGYCEFALKPILNPDADGNCEFKGVIYGDASLYRAQILDGSAVVKNQTSPLVFSVTTKWNEFSVNYPCQANPKVRLTQTEAGTAPAVSLGVYYGKATNIGSGTPPNTFSAKVSATGVLSDIVNGDYFNGTTFAPTDTSLYTIAFKGLTSAPNCNLTLAHTDVAANLSIKFDGGSPTSSSAIVRTGYSQTSTSFQKTAYAFLISCTKTGSDVVQPTITAQNYNFSDRVFAPSVSGQGSGSATVNSATLSRNGTKATICLRATKDATAGTGGSTVTFSMPSGITAVMPSGQAAFVGTGFAVIAGSSNFSLATSGSNLFFYLGGGFFTGASWSASSDINGCVTFPAAENGVPWTETMNAPQLLGSVTSDANFAEKLVRVHVNGGNDSTNCTGTCTLSNTNSNAFTSVSNVGGGSYTAVISGFSGTPLCWCNAYDTANPADSCGIKNNTSTSLAIRVLYGTTLTNGIFDIFCLGPR